jgi:hypothetical protein
VYQGIRQCLVMGTKNRWPSLGEKSVFGCLKLKRPPALSRPHDAGQIPSNRDLAGWLAVSSPRGLLLAAAPSKGNAGGECVRRSGEKKKKKTADNRIGAGSEWPRPEQPRRRSTTVRPA